MSLSMAILIGWQLYVVKPDLEAQRDAYNQQTETGIPAPASGAAQPATTSEQSAAVSDTGTRITISGPSISGSLSTMGGRVDDIILTQYAETQDENSDAIHLLLPFDSQAPYFAETGWTAPPQSQLALPGPQTVWQASSDSLTPERPLTLSWDNAQGLTFYRTFSIGDDYLITITDSVSSNADTVVELSPYGLIRRTGTPQTSGLYILHEGP